MTFNTLLDNYRKVSTSERDKGDRFERLMKAYLLTDPKYSNKFKKVWLWNEFPGKREMGGSDTGIDLVALTHEGDYWAVQCKCYAENATIDKPAVDTFISTSGRDFWGEDLKTASFSHRLWISTTNKWGSNAEEAIKNQNPPFTRLNLYDLQEAPVNWEKLDQGIHGEQARNPKKTLRPHQVEALEKAHQYFKTSDRGKLIMACGTGKTLNALRIAENETNGKGLILFLVPSIALLGQTLREWSADAEEPINAVCICSDPKVSRKTTKNEDSDSSSIVDLALPASTNTKDIIHQFHHFKAKGKKGLTVVFSTYQSIDVVSRAQKEIIKQGFGEFDLIICDEAHRTTGVSLAGEDESSFTKVHNNKFLQAKKRLYMTATPRLYSEDVKSKAAQAEALLCSMDDAALYGEEIYRIGFGEAVERDLLTDYKVLILTLREIDVPPAIQKMISDENGEINADDASKLIGCINALSKRILGDDGATKASDPAPMKKAVAFCQKIVDSKKITKTFNDASSAYIGSLPSEQIQQMVSVDSKHIDGTMSAPQRDDLLGWLKSDSPGDECKVLTNVRCLSEGVDVPSLDAVMFLSARNSQIDVVQSVGRVMRKSPGKKYGYIIIPVLAPVSVEADKALDDNERYKVVWTVLNALRAHDDRFNATVNKIELNQHKPHQIVIGGLEYSFDPDGNPVKVAEGDVEYGAASSLSEQIAMDFKQLQSQLLARMVKKVGEKTYWEQWAKSVGEIAERQVERIDKLITDDKKHQRAFANFLGGLQKNINPSITKQEAVEMLSQHIITKPVFEALFEGYSFVKNNPISISMQSMLDLLEEQALEEDTATLQKFYESVRMKASGIDNAAGRQTIITELYDKFFKTAFPKMVERLGIVYTPIEVVDFIIHSVNDILQKEFGRSISDENVHVLDPFTGTGTFVTRLIQSGLISKEDLERKYLYELHANEIVLLAYYIAAVNIENAYHDAMGEIGYTSFDGICLTDTFQLGEKEKGEQLSFEMFPQNFARVSKQKKAPVMVIMGNPPYSVGQKSENDIAQNQTYETLNDRIELTYARDSKATSVKALYDAYIKAFRWSTDRLDPLNGGIICFVSNSGWLEGSGMDGFRKCLGREFSSIYVFNLRGNARTQGELRRKEAGNVFGGGSRTPIAITLLVKNPNSKGEESTIYYYDIGDYLSREGKLSKLEKFRSVENTAIEWKTLLPNEHGDWVSQRNDVFQEFIPMDPIKKTDPRSESIFVMHSLGVNTSRDVWCHNYSQNNLAKNIRNTIAFYNDQLIAVQKAQKRDQALEAKDVIDTDPLRISWDRGLINRVSAHDELTYDSSHIYTCAYRPFSRQHLYYDRALNAMVYQNHKLFPTNAIYGRTICVSTVGSNSGLSVLATDHVANYHFNGDTQCFPLYYYEAKEKSSPNLFDGGTAEKLTRKDGISDFILERAKALYGKTVGKEDIFYYVYGFLHSPEYRIMFANDLKKMLPRLPLVEDVRDFWKFSKAGRQLAELHINYESEPAYKDAKVTGEDSGDFTVVKMRFPAKDKKDTIVFNNKITISNIPAKAYEYVVNGKSAIEWIMERYQVKIDKDSGIKNDPNDWAKEVGNPRYILDLLLSIINVSVQTVDIVAGLPKVKFE